MSPLPPGLVRCEVCGEANGTTEARYLNEGYPSPPATRLSATCLCHGIPCGFCQTNMIHRPLTGYYDERHNRVWYVPHFGCMSSCDECRDNHEGAPNAYFGGGAARLASKRGQIVRRER